MKLETFLLLRKGRVFIPSFELLGSSDPLEGKIVFSLSDAFWSDHAHEISSHVGRWQPNLLHRQQPGYPYQPTPYTYTQIVPAVPSSVDIAKDDFRLWLSELSRERCVWCWNRFEKQSHAMWKIYGERGVAVRSTIGSVLNALDRAGARRGIVAAVFYVDADLPDWEDVFRPHLLKSASFEYEDEIRFVLGVHRQILRERKGVLIKVDADSIFSKPSDVLVSPQLQPEERITVQQMIGEINSNAKPLPGVGDDWERLYEANSQAPFPRMAETPGCFQDLD